MCAPAVSQVVHGYWETKARVPRLKKELDRLDAAGIVAKVREPSDWVSPLVIARQKNDQFRICMDPRKVNQALKREHFQFPRRQEIESELAGAK